MLAKVFSAATAGLSAEVVEVEVDLGQGLPAFSIVGLPDAAVQEAKERVKSAIKNAGYAVHGRRVTVNLAPADIRKSGPSYDLPIAVGMLAASRQLRLGDGTTTLFIGELALDGATRPVAGILPIVLGAKKKGFTQFFIPAANAREAAMLDGVTIFPVDHLRALVLHFTGEELITPEPHLDPASFMHDAPPDVDFSHVAGQDHAKRALVIAAAGGHNVLMSGPPGSGKTMLARAFRGILPALTLAEILEVTQIYSVAGLLRSDEPLIATRPFRVVHHTASGVAIVGGGTSPGPGEISLAHRGVLFLDEFAEFPSKVLEVMRQPLEDGTITISRASGSLSFPARFSLVAAMNPCPCGYASDPEIPCKCSPMEITRYTKRISGPILDRIDIHLEVPRQKIETLVRADAAEDSATLRARVATARERQKHRFAKRGISCNAEMTSTDVKKYCPLQPDADALMRQAVDHFRLSARAYYRLLKLARTIADVEGLDEIATQHVAEALQYRPKMHAQS